MAVLSVASISRAGITPSLANAASGGDSFPNDGQVFVEVVNAHVSNPRTITFVTQATVDGQAVADRTVTVAAATRRFVGPFPPGQYNDGNDRVVVTYSDSAADVTIGAFKLTPT